MKHEQRMVVGLDIDGTITAAPDFFRMVSDAVYKTDGRVIVVSARSNTSLSRTETAAELQRLGIRYSKLFLLPEGGAMLGDPPTELGCLERYLWQKVHICESEGVEVFFDDDDTVVSLFAHYTTGIQVFQPVFPIYYR